MILEFPEYYNKFQCIADRCPDTCCRDWELDLDDETYYRYQVVPGAFGEKIRGLIREDGEYRYFPLREDGFCPFYDRDGLCSIIKKLGYDALCQACDEYPRYFGCCGDYEQRDLSLSCPEAGRLLFESDAPVRYFRIRMPDEEEDPNEGVDTALRDRVLYERDRVLSSLREEDGLSCRDKLKKAGIFFPCTPEETAELCRKQEEMNAKWDGELARIEKAAGEAKTLYPAFAAAVPMADAWFAKLASYFVFRYWIDAYFASADSGKPLSFDPEIRFACRSLQQILLQCLAVFSEKGSFSREDMIFVCHIFSRQVEHSDVNVALFQKEN